MLATSKPLKTNDRESRPRETPDIDSSTDDYARRFAGGVGAYFLEVQSRLVLDALKPYPGASVLDVGGGHAQLAGPLTQHGHPVTVLGSDSSCRARLDATLKPNAFTFQTGDLLNLPFETNQFDAVVSIRMMSHLEQWPRFISELCRVARKTVVVDYPDKRSFNAISDLVFGAKKALEGNTRTYRCFRRGELLQEFEQHHFAEPRFQPQFFFPMVIHRALRTPIISKTLETPAKLTGLTRLFGSPIILSLKNKSTD